jgi:hypothetical protein
MAVLAGLFLMNYRIARGFELERPPAVRPAPRLRQSKVDTRMPAGWPRDPVVNALLRSLDWGRLLKEWPGWSWEAESGALLCPDGRELVLTTVRSEDRTSGNLVFCRPARGCEDCEPHEECFRSTRPKAVKHAQFTVPRETAELLRARLATIRGKGEAGARLELVPVEGEAGLREVITPLFLPAAARRRYDEIFAEASVRITLSLPRAAPPRPRLVAADEAERQERREVWFTRNGWNALPEGAKVWLEVTGGADLRSVVGLAARRTAVPLEAG